MATNPNKGGISMTLRERYLVWLTIRDCKRFSKKAKKLEAKAMKKYRKTSERLQNLRNSL